MFFALANKSVNSANTVLSCREYYIPQLLSLSADGCIEALAYPLSLLQPRPLSRVLRPAISLAAPWDMCWPSLGGRRSAGKLTRVDADEAPVALLVVAEGHVAGLQRKQRVIPPLPNQMCQSSYPCWVKL